MGPLNQRSHLVVSGQGRWVLFKMTEDPKELSFMWIIYITVYCVQHEKALKCKLPRTRARIALAFRAKVASRAIQRLESPLRTGGRQRRRVTMQASCALCKGLEAPGAFGPRFENSCAPVLDYCPEWSCEVRSESKENGVGLSDDHRDRSARKLI